MIQNSSGLKTISTDFNRSSAIVELHLIETLAIRKYREGFAELGVLLVRRVAY